MAHHEVQRRARAQRVAQNRDSNAGPGQPLGHETEIVLAEGLPVAAMDEDVQARCIRLRQEQVEARRGVLGIGDVQLCLRLTAKLGAAGFPGLEDSGRFGNAAAGIVLQAQLVGRHVAIERLVHRAFPLPPEIECQG